jgi:hypothetical protein
MRLLYCIGTATAHQSKYNLFILCGRPSAFGTSGRAVFGVGLGSRVVDAIKSEEHMFSITVYGREHAGNHEAQLWLYGVSA